MKMDKYYVQVAFVGMSSDMPKHMPLVSTCIDFIIITISSIFLFNFAVV